MAVPPQRKAQIVTLAVNSAFMMKGKKDEQDEVYVVIVNDPANNVFTGTRIADKTSANFLTDASNAQATEVVIIEDLAQSLPTTAIGSKLLSEL